MSSQQFGRYEILAELGRGGMATVYHARDPRINREVAVKVLPREFLHDPHFRARFEREAHTIAALEHPAIVPIHDFGEEGGQPYIVMRYMSGGSLADRLLDGPIPVEEAVSILGQLAPALDKAHSRGIIHRDLKPGNILFDADGNAYLSDFGIVKLAEATSTLTGGGTVGTPAYMSPEQVHGEGDLDGRSDVYALGVILYQMLTGDTPYHAETPARLMMKHILDPIPSLLDRRPDLPESLDGVIARAMGKSREDRFQTAADMVRTLERAAGDTIPSRAERTAIEAPAEEIAYDVTADVTAGSDWEPGRSEQDSSSTLPSQSVRARGVRAHPAPAQKPTGRQIPSWLWGAVAMVGVALAIMAGVVVALIVRNSMSGQEAADRPAAGISGEATEEESEAAPIEQPTSTAQPAATAVPTVTLGSEEKPIVFVFVVSSGLERTTAAANDVTARLSERTGLVIEASVLTGYSVVIEALCAGEAHMGALNTFSYLVAHERDCADAALVAERSGATYYNAQIITRADSGIDRIADLWGHTFCRPDALSTTGWIIPGIMMRASGVDPDTDLDVLDAGSHDGVVSAVYDGVCDAGATFVDARTIVQGDHPDVMEEVLQIAVSDPIPNDNISFAPAMPEDIRAEITAALIEMTQNEADLAIMEELYLWQGLVEIDDSFYDDFRATVEASGVDVADYLSE